MAGAFGGADYRQAIVLALQQEGGDVARGVIDLLRDIGREQDVVNKQWQEGSITGAQYIAMQAKLISEGDGWRQKLREIRDEQSGLTAAMEETLVPLNKLIVDSLKFVDVQRKIADTAQAKSDRAQQLREEAELQDYLGRKTREAAQASEAAQRANADAHARGTQAVNGFVAAVHAEAAAAREAAAAEDREFDEVEQLNQAWKYNAENVGMATRATREQVQALKDMGIIQDAVTTRVAQGKGQFGGFATAAEEAADKTKRMGQTALNASYLIQDMQYGIGAVANNVGIMSSSLARSFPAIDAFITKIGVPGGAVGLGAGIMVAAVAADVLYHNWGTVAAALGAGLPPKVLGDTKELEERLKALTEKTWKTSVDYRNIAEAREELEKLQADEAAYRRLKGQKTEAQQKQSEVVTRAIVEGGGGDDYRASVDNVVAAVMESRGDAKSTMMQALEERLGKAREEHQQQARSGVDDFGASIRAVGDLEDRIKAQEVADRESRERKAREVVTRAAQGNVGALGDLSAAFGATPDAFTRRGVDPLRFGAGLENARPENLFGPERRKLEEERLKKEQAAADRQASLREKVKAEMARDMDQGEAQVAREAKKSQDAKETEGVDQIRINDRLKREKEQADKAAARDARNAQDTPAEQARKAQMAYGQEFQSRAMKSGVPVSGQQATAAGKDIAGMVGGGADVDSAMRQALANLSALVGRQNMQALRNAAAWERLNGIVGEATMAVNMIETQQRRAQQVTRTNNVHP